MKLFISLTLATSLATAAARAQPFQERPRRMAPGQRHQERPGRMEPGGDGTGGPLLMQVRKQRIQDALGLSEDRAKSLAERWARYDGDFIQRARELGKLRGLFNDILLSPGSEEDKNNRLRPLVDQFMDQRKQQADLKTRFEDDIRSGLTPAQQVRLIILVDDLTRQIREGIRETLKEGRPGRRF